MALPDFICLQCGRCCTNLIKESQGTRKGLPIFPKERILFSNDIVKPHIGIGRNTTARKFRVILYQMIENICPHLENNECKIYDNRPVACRAFPLYPHITIGEGVTMKIDLACTALKKLGIHYPHEDVFFTEGSLKNELLYVNELSKISSQAHRNIKRTWIFDLKSDKWIRFRDIVKSYE